MMGYRQALLCAGLAACGAAALGAPTEFRARVEADWLRQDTVRSAGAAAAAQAVTREEDAAGGVDGIKDGKWGFHTEAEQDPWWQVDLAAPVALGRLVLYNRTELGERNARIGVSVSDDGRAFRTIYRHDGRVFLGHADGKPLEVELGGVAARYLRLGLQGHSYFHLDEVELYAPGSTTNLALGRPATQSSTSQWSARHGAGAARAHAYPTAAVAARGVRLAERLRRMGVAVDGPLAALRAAAADAAALPVDAPEAARRAAYLRARWAVRGLALANPLLDFDTILFAKRAPGMFPHLSDQHYGWWSRPGGGVYALTGFKGDAPALRCLTADMPAGSFGPPELSYDGREVLFAYCRHVPGLADERRKSEKARVPAEAFHHVYAMCADGSGRRALTGGRYDDFDPRWLPDGSIAFISTRKGTALPVTAASVDATRAADLPDSYVRCGGDDYRPVPVFTLHGMDADGRNIRPLSAFENFEWSPSVAHDGRILFTRWDYIDRFNGHFFSLWSASPDGTGAQLVYGNFTVRPQAVMEARAIPNSSRLVFTAAAHHSITGGALCLLDRTRGTEEQAPLTRLTPEVCFPETEGWPGHYYATPYPLSEEFFLVAWSDVKLPPHCRATEEQNPANAQGLYLYDAFGNLELLHRDPAISSVGPIPLAPRPRPPAFPRPDVAAASRPDGACIVQDVYRGLDGVARGTVRRLRVVAVPPKVQPHMNTPSLGVSHEDPGKFVLGTAPVEPDGSAHFRLPAGVPVFLQALDAEGVAVQTMRTLIYAMPGQTMGCIGCHESRASAPPSGALLHAARRAPSGLAPGPAGSWPLRFDRLVQPVLDRHCVACHRPGGPNPAAVARDLTPPRAYATLLAAHDEDLAKQAFERDRSVPGQATAARSRLWAMLTSGGGHHDVRLDAADRERLATWIDTYAQRAGQFSDEQERELEALRTAWTFLVESPPGM